MNRLNRRQFLQWSQFSFIPPIKLVENQLVSRKMQVEVVIDNGLNAPKVFRGFCEPNTPISETLKEVCQFAGLPISFGVNPDWQNQYQGEQIQQIGGFWNADIDPLSTPHNRYWTIFVSPSQQWLGKRRGLQFMPIKATKQIQYLLLGPSASATTSRLSLVTPRNRRGNTLCAPRVYLYYGEPSARQ